MAYDSVYLVWLSLNLSGVNRWTVHCPESPRCVTLPAADRSEGTLAMRVIAHKAQVDIEKLEY